MGACLELSGRSPTFGAQGGVWGSTPEAWAQPTGARKHSYSLRQSVGGFVYNNCELLFEDNKLLINVAARGARDLLFAGKWGFMNLTVIP